MLQSMGVFPPKKPVERYAVMSVALIVTRPFTALAISARRGEHLSVVFAYRFTTVSRCSRVAAERAVAVIGAGRPGVEESLL